jgi:hypothetical protein
MGVVKALWLDDFEAKALKLLKLVRAALIYLSNSVHYEERRREKISEELVGAAYLPTYKKL